MKYVVKACRCGTFFRPNFLKLRRAVDRACRLSAEEPGKEGVSAFGTLQEQGNRVGAQDALTRNTRHDFQLATPQSSR